MGLTRQDLLASAIEQVRAERITTPHGITAVAQGINLRSMAPADVQITAAMIRERLLTPTNLAEAVAIATENLKKRSSGSATVWCEMWDSETKRWYSGSSGKPNRQGLVPAEIWDRIPKDLTNADRAEWCFGINCAEVHTLVNAYAAGKRATNLQGCYFVAFRASDKSRLGACRTCRRWIIDSGGQAYGAA
ncbi:hypothetical protein [Polyangium mundeleinium]|uniref:Uncharacterized protein n=1 Tax=Polyangium mundeleinium TaxID=2995306 RepID=A0ABT5F5B4_9BACT|nr:hypothetical protein [Polyangium mundeleinium]MDC0749146.1 hypothetical protein [Polyangium mundeleinium]